MCQSVDIKPFNTLLIQLHMPSGMNIFGNVLRPFFCGQSKRQEPNLATVSHIRDRVRRKTFQPGSLCFYQCIPETFMKRWEQKVITLCKD